MPSLRLLYHFLELNKVEAGSDNASSQEGKKTMFALTFPVISWQVLVVLSQMSSLTPLPVSPAEWRG
jgi:hypothetical protein